MKVRAPPPKCLLMAAKRIKPANLNRLMLPRRDTGCLRRRRPRITVPHGLPRCGLNR